MHTDAHRHTNTRTQVKYQGQAVSRHPHAVHKLHVPDFLWNGPQGLRLWIYLSYLCVITVLSVSVGHPGKPKRKAWGEIDNSSHGYRSVWKEPEEHLHAGLVLPTGKSSTHPQGAGHCLSSIVLENNTPSQTVEKTARLVQHFSKLQLF